jgi:hypothetical protein
VRGKSVSREKYWIVTGLPSSSKLKSETARLGRILPCLSRTVASTFTTRTFDEIVVTLVSPVADLAEAGLELWLNDATLRESEIPLHRIRENFSIRGFELGDGVGLLTR